MVKVFDKRAMDVVLPKLDELLLQAKKQPPEEPIISEPHPGLPKGARIIRSIQFADLVHGQHSFEVAHGSGEKCAEGVCGSDHVEPWEISDGAIHLLNELSAICPKEMAKRIPQLAELARVSGFHHADCLRETIYICLPSIMRNVGKPICKMNLEFFYDGLFKTFKESKPNLANAAKECIKDLGKFIGPTILKGRLKEYRPEYAETYELLLEAKS